MAGTQHHVIGDLYEFDAPEAWAPPSSEDDDGPSIDSPGAVALVAPEGALIQLMAGPRAGEDPGEFVHAFVSSATGGEAPLKDLTHASGEAACEATVERSGDVKRVLVVAGERSSVVVMVVAKAAIAKKLAKKVDALFQSIVFGEGEVPEPPPPEWRAADDAPPGFKIFEYTDGEAAPLVRFTVPAVWEPGDVEGGPTALSFEVGEGATVQIDMIPPELELVHSPKKALLALLKKKVFAGERESLEEFPHPSGAQGAKLALRSAGEHTRAYVVQGHECCVVAYLCAKDLDDEEDFDAAVSSITFAPRGDTSFAQHVCRILETNHPELSFEVRDVDLIAVSKYGVEGEGQLGLSNLMRMVEADRERADEIIEEHVEKLGLASLFSDEKRELDPGKLYPRIRDEREIPKPPGHEGPLFLPFFGRLKIAIVSDEGFGDRYVYASELEAAGLTPASTLARAVANLEAHVKGKPIKAMNGPDGKVAAIIIEGFTHAAGLLVTPSFHDRMSELLGDTFYACVPTIDHLVAFRRKPRSLVKGMVKGARAIYEESPHVVTDKVFKVQADRIVPVRIRYALAP